MSNFYSFSSSRGLSVLELMVTLIILAIVCLSSLSLYRTGHSVLLRSSAAEVVRFIRANQALSYLNNRQTQITVSRPNGSLEIQSGPALLAPSVSFSKLKFAPPVRIASATFGDLDPSTVQLILRPTGSATPGNIRLDTGENSPGCSLILSLRGSIQSICD